MIIKNSKVDKFGYKLESIEEDEKSILYSFYNVTYKNKENKSIKLIIYFYPDMSFFKFIKFKKYLLTKNFVEVLADIIKNKYEWPWKDSDSIEVLRDSLWGKKNLRSIIPLTVQPKESICLNDDEIKHLMILLQDDKEMAIKACEYINKTKKELPKKQNLENEQKKLTNMPSLMK